MALVRRERPWTSLDPIERLFEGLPAWVRRPVGLSAVDGMIDIEEYRDDGTLVIRADVAGIDPDKDVEITLSEGVLHIGVERREEKKVEEKQYYRRELQYGSFTRDLPLPEGVTGDDVKATYRDGVLEIRVPLPKAQVEQAPKKIRVTTT